MEKANPLIETEDDNPEQLTGGGALSGTVPSSTSGAQFSLASTTQLSAGVAPAGSSGISRSSGTHPRALKPVESGVFSGLAGQVTGEQLVDSLQSALSAASRGEAGLGSLQRSVRDASRALTSLRHAHESLGEELRLMYRGLNEVMSEKAAVERYAALLTQERDAALDAAEEARREAKREREFLLREQDRFIQLLLEEHEAELQQLRRALSGRSSAPPPVIFPPAVVPPAVVSAASAPEADVPEESAPAAGVSAAGVSAAGVSAAGASAASVSAASVHAAPPAVVVHTEPTTGFRIGVEVKPGERSSEGLEVEVEVEATLRASDERRAVVPMPRRELDETPLRSARGDISGVISRPGAPLGRLQLAPSEPPAPGEPDVEEPAGTVRGIGERDSVLDRSLAERHLLDTLYTETQRSEGVDADGQTRTYPPPPAVLDLDSLAAEVEGNSERPPPIRRIGAVEPKLHLKPAKVPTQLLDTLISRTDGEEGDDRPQDKLQDES